MNSKAEIETNDYDEALKEVNKILHTLDTTLDVGLDFDPVDNIKSGLKKISLVLAGFLMREQIKELRHKRDVARITQNLEDINIEISNINVPEGEVDHIEIKITGDRATLMLMDFIKGVWVATVLDQNGNRALTCKSPTELNEKVALLEYLSEGYRQRGEFIFKKLFTIAPKLYELTFFYGGTDELTLENLFNDVLVGSFNMTRESKYEK